MTGYTEQTISLKTLLQSIWSKYKPFLNQYAEKNQLEGWIKFIKKILIEWSVSTQKQTLSKVSACCRCSLLSWLLVGTGLLARCHCNNHNYFSGLLQVQQTAQMVGYYYNKYECWSSASVSDMHACRYEFTEMTAGKMQLLKTWEMAWCNCYRHGWWSGANVIYMDPDTMKL